MHDFMKTIISALQSWTNDKIKDSTADWNQNDEKANDYIKNRPFYESTEDFVIVPEQTITLENGSAYVEHNTVENMWNNGTEYTVIFDGFSYTGTTREDSDACIRTDFVTNDGYKVEVYNYCNIDASGMTGEHTIQIILNNMSNVVKLDKKFLPDDTVSSVNGKTGDVYLDAFDVGAATTTQLNDKMDKSNPVGTGSFSMNRRRSGTVGDYSHTEGSSSMASGTYSHAEGYYTTASGTYSHAEGHSTTASGTYSHAEGYYTTASGNYSHAEGYQTIASGSYSHVEGKYNIDDANGKYIHIVGNGNYYYDRSNAHTLDLNGVGWYQGGLQVGGNAQDDGAKNVLLEGDALGIKDVQGYMPIYPVSITYGSGKFVAIGFKRAVYSYDGIMWTETTLPIMPDNINMKSIIYENGKFVVITSSNTTDTDIVFYSEDGITWNQTTLPVSNRWKSITYGSGKFVAIGDNMGYRSAVYSYDGIIWAETTMPGDAYTTWLSVTYNGGKFIAIGAGYTAAYSEDGIIWTQTRYPVASQYVFKAYGNGKFILMGITGTIVYSEDGITWNQTTMPVSANYRSIIYGNGKFVVIGIADNTTSSGNTTDTNIVFYSEDGITWNQTTLPVDQDWASIIYENGKFVVVGNGKGNSGGGSTIAAYSEDGITWIQATMPIKAVWESITYGGGKFVAFAPDSETIAYSEDGIIWHDSTYNRLFQGNEDITDEVRDLILKDSTIIPAIRNSQVGQTIVVSEVDETGKPTAWETVTLTADDVGALPDTTVIPSIENFTLTDTSTGTKYKLSVTDGQLNIVAITE